MVWEFNRDVSRDIVGFDGMHQTLFGDVEDNC